MEIVRQRLLYVLERRGLTANNVSERAGLSRSALARFLNGKVGELRDSNIRSLAKVLRVDVSYIRGETNDLPDEEIDANRLMRLRIETRVRELGYSVSRVSEMAGLNRSALSKFLKGHVEELRDSNLRAVAEVLKVDPAYLRGETSGRDLSDETQLGSLHSRQISPRTMVRRVGVVEAGTWRSETFFESRELGELVNTYDLSFPLEEMSAWRLRDNSLDDLGLFEGDDLITVDPWESRVRLKTGRIVVVSRRHPDAKDIRQLVAVEFNLEPARYFFRFRDRAGKLENFSLPLTHDLRFDPNTRILGVVVGHHRDWGVEADEEDDRISPGAHYGPVRETARVGMALVAAATLTTAEMLPVPAAADPTETREIYESNVEPVVRNHYRAVAHRASGNTLHRHN